jgi:hypothetical protein
MGRFFVIPLAVPTGFEPAIYEKKLFDTTETERTLQSMVAKQFPKPGALFMENTW